MLNFVRLMAICIVLGMCSVGAAGAADDDIRVVIDVSGSMKKTDPSNLRVSALKLLNGLIPEGSHAGVWTFGRYVDMAVKWGKVDAQWRKRADLGAETIHANALFTNIESALSRATKGWEKADQGTRRNLILLTDGHVDISKNAEKNAQSRAAILDHRLQQLKQSGIRVRTIALSDDADEVLLKRLALETGGSFEVAASAVDLQKIFFKMFERATQPDTVSIKDNQFKVDTSIKEMTLLVFRKPGSKSTKIFSPDGKRYSARRPGNSLWRSDEGYDLITIKKPFKGLWSIDADMDPDNRIMVVTDLALDLAEIPVPVLPGQQISIVASLYNNDKQIRKNSFLRFVEFNITHTDSDGNETASRLEHSKDRSRKGQYLYDFADGFTEGPHTIVVTADSRTFTRSKRVELNVQWPVEVKIEPAETVGNYRFSVSAREEYIDPKTLKPTVNLTPPGGEPYPLIFSQEETAWVASVATGMEGIYQARVEIEATNQSGNPVKLDLGKYAMVGVYNPPPQETLAASENQPLDDLTENHTKTDANAIEEGPVDDGPDWIMTSIVIGVSNLVLILVAGGLFLLLRRKSTEAELLLE